MASAVDKGVDQFGYLRRDDLVAAAEDDDLLKKTPMGKALFEENLPDYVDVPLGAEDCQDLELGLDPKFVNSMRKLIQGVESGEIPLEQWRTVDA
jgi:hypothetical protein